MAVAIGLRIEEAKFWDRDDLRLEVDRIFDICDSCRLCFKFCGSFPALFEAIDGRTARNREQHLRDHPELAREAARRRAEVAARGAIEHDPSAHAAEVAETFGDELPHLAAHARDVSDAEVDRIVDLCFQCKLCDPNCPYTPPHEYALDFPRLMLRWKAQRARRVRPHLGMRLLQSPRVVGRISSWVPALARFGTTNRLARWVLEKALGVDRRKELPAIHAETFPRWWRRRGRPALEPPLAPREGAEAILPTKVVLFSTCLVDFNAPQTGISATRVLEHNGIEVAFPGPQGCCGMPKLDGGDLAAAAALARRNVALLAPWVGRGYRIVVPSPSCSLMIRQEYPQIAPGPQTDEVAGATLDLCDYLFKLGREGRIKKDFVRRIGPVKYHVPCHLRVQQIGFRGRDILRWCSESVDAIQECTGHDGTWSMQVEHFADSLRWGQKAFAGMTPAAGEACSAACSDCALAGTQIHQGTGISVLHPIVVLAYAYGHDVGAAAAHLRAVEAGPR